MSVSTITTYLKRTPTPTIFDPIEVLATCALLKYKEPNSLFTFSGKKSNIQQPSQYQWGRVKCRGLVRTFLGQSRNDIHVIKQAILVAAQLFQPHRKENKNYKILFIHAAKGLEELKQTYKNKANGGLVVEAIGGYQSKIMFLTTKKGMIGKTPLGAITEKIKRLWSDIEIQKINVLLGQMQEKQGKTTLGRHLMCVDEIKQLELLLDLKHAELKKENFWDDS